MLTKSQWTPARDAKLRDLWQSGMTTAVIAIMIDATKNAVIGRAHRLGLAGRKDPITRDPSKPRVERKLRVPAEPQRAQATRVPFEQPPEPLPVKVPEAKAARLTVDGRVWRAGSAPSVTPAPKLLPSEAAALGPGRCQWIEGEPTADDYCKCGLRAIPGRPYCPDHEARAYQRRQPDAPEAA